MAIRPLGDKILLKRLQAEEKTAGGIYLPESAKEKPQQAEVVATGDGRLLDNGSRADFQVKKGDKVVISKWGGTEVKVDGEELLILPEEDILAALG